MLLQADESQFGVDMLKITSIVPAQSAFVVQGCAQKLWVLGPWLWQITPPASAGWPSDGWQISTDGQSELVLHWLPCPPLPHVLWARRAAQKNRIPKVRMLSLQNKTAQYIQFLSSW